MMKTPHYNVQFVSILLLLLAGTGQVYGTTLPPQPERRTYVVAQKHPQATDQGPGTKGRPFKTIAQAAALAQPGDSIIVYSGIYRERVTPARGGVPGKPIVYRAATGEKVIIKGSEEVKNWVKLSNGTWKAAFTPSFFGKYNPFQIPMAHWEKEKQKHHTLGEVYVDGRALTEAKHKDSVAFFTDSWKASTDGFTVYANFGKANPNKLLTEINVREQLFAPEAYNLGYITLSGFYFEHSANQFPHDFYASHGFPQKGAVSTMGGHDWIIENCTINHAKTVALDFGYVGVNVMTSAGYDIAKGNPYQLVGRMGHHLIRNNVVLNAGAIGIAGAWAPFTRIIGNRIENTNKYGFTSPETAGIKTHHFMDGRIEKNILRNNNCAGVWADNTYQGVRISSNIFVHNRWGIFTEMGFGPLLIDNNVFIQSPMRQDDSAGATLVHNLFYDCDPPRFKLWKIRKVHIYAPHSVETVGKSIPANMAYHKYFNNIFIKRGIAIPPDTTYRFGNQSDYNVFMDGAERKAGYDANSISSPQETGFAYESTQTSVTVKFKIDQAPWQVKAPLISAAFIGKDPVTGASIEAVERDFFANPRSGAAVIPGPWAHLRPGYNAFVLWQKE